MSEGPVMTIEQLVYLGGCLAGLGILAIGIVSYTAGKLRGERNSDYQAGFEAGEDAGYTDGYADGVTDGMEHGIKTNRGG